MITTVTLNPSLDVIDGISYAGGGGINVARVLARWDVPTWALTFAGGATGDDLLKALKAEGVNALDIPTVDYTRVTLYENGKRVAKDCSFCQPPEITRKEQQRFKLRYQGCCCQSDIVVLSGSVPLGYDDNIYAELTDIAHEQGAKVVLDTYGDWLPAGIMAQPELAKPSVNEIDWMLNLHRRDDHTVIAAAKLLHVCGAEVAVVSRGTEGMIVVGNDRIIKTVPPKVDIICEIGAGDSAVAGFVLGMRKGFTLEDQAVLATAMGTAACLTTGNELCYNEDVMWLLKKIHFEELK